MNLVDRIINGTFSPDYPKIPEEHRANVRALLDFPIKEAHNYDFVHRAFYAPTERQKRLTNFVNLNPDDIEKVKVVINGKTVNITCTPIVNSVTNTLRRMKKKSTL